VESARTGAVAGGLIAGREGRQEREQRSSRHKAKGHVAIIQPRLPARRFNWTRTSRGWS
jgi:hypothetical protein